MTEARSGARHAPWLPALCVVAISDRRMMVPAEILAGAWPGVAAAFGAAVARAVAGCPPGSVVVQIREKDLDGGLLLQLVRAAQPFAPIVVNDRVDIALAAGAAGVHLPERGLAIADARALAPSLMIGVSRHRDTLGGLGSGAAGAAGSAVPAAGSAVPHAAGSTVPDAAGSAVPNAAGSAVPNAAGSAVRHAAGSAVRYAAGSAVRHAAGSGAPDAAGPAVPDAAGSGAPDAAGPAVPDAARNSALPDLIQLGPIWPTPSKPTVPGLGEAALAFPHHPTVALVAVGGIDTPTRATAAAAAGADAVAVIRAAWSGASLAPFVAAVQAGRARRSL